MKVEYHACDRCKQKILGAVGELEGSVRMPSRIFGEMPWNTVQVELCKSCVDELLKWLKGAA